MHHDFYEYTNRTTFYAKYGENTHFPHIPCMLKYMSKVIRTLKYGELMDDY